MTDDTVKLNDTYLEVYFGDRRVVDSGKTSASLSRDGCEHDEYQSTSMRIKSLPIRMIKQKDKASWGLLTALLSS